jgi:hypothetical protein
MNLNNNKKKKRKEEKRKKEKRKKEKKKKKPTDFTQRTNKTNGTITNSSQCSNKAFPSIFTLIH